MLVDSVANFNPIYAWSTQNIIVDGKYHATRGFHSFEVIFKRERLSMITQSLKEILYLLSMRHS